VIANFLIVLLMNITFAGNEVGNGGDAIICPKKAPVLLDFYENRNAKLPYKIRKSEKTDEYEYLRDIWDKLSKTSPRFYKKYSADLMRFKNRVKLVSGESFRDVKDSFHISVPKGCRIVQLAIQRKDAQSKETVFYINKDIYEKMDAKQRAGLISHEIIYEHFRYFGQNHSVNVREFNRFLFSEKLVASGKEGFVKFIQEMGIPGY
jgi:hypothetical protein